MEQKPPELPAVIPFKRKRRLINGKRILLKNAASAKNGKPKKIFPVHGGASKVLRSGVLHAGGVLGRAFYDEVKGLTAHLGGDPTRPQARLIEQGGRLHLLEAMGWAEVLGAGCLIRPDGSPYPAVDVLLRVMRERRETLKLLGLKRHTKLVPTLQEVLQGGGNAAR